MLNREKYEKEIIEIACNGGNIAVVNGKLKIGVRFRLTHRFL